MVATAALVDPVRLQILHLLRAPQSAADLARSLGTSRQRVAYHVRALRRDRLVETAATRRKGNCVERLLRVTAHVHTLAPELVGALGADPETVQDRLSSAYLSAVAARVARDVTALEQRARAAGRKLPTLTLHTTVRFASAADQHAFAEDLSQAVTRLVAKYHDERAERGRSFTVVAAAYPALPPEENVP
ncbi:MAG TPA: winged helix-turn-helix domain-containing protein [Vicinamibacterales bacterium]|nr:winged helix-turn-helix domain-containing protein [Vicinamibacterales bacterium]